MGIKLQYIDDPYFFIDAAKNLGYSDEYIERLENSFLKKEYPRESDIRKSKKLIKRLGY